MPPTQTDSLVHPLPSPASSTQESSAPETAWHARLLQLLRALLSGVTIRRRERSLRICESLPLGEKRLLAVVQFEGRRFLIGATNESIALLDRLDPPSAARQQPDRQLESSFLHGVH